MNFKKFLFVVCVFTLTQLSMSQKKEKIKGNREVTVNITELNAFNAIELNDDFEIELLEGSNNNVEIEADSNLHEVIEFQVNDSILSFSKNKRITSKKKLRILVSFSSQLNDISLSENSEIRSLNSLRIDSLNLNTSDYSKAYINLDSRVFNLNAYGKSKLKLNIRADKSEITLAENSKLDGSLNTDTSVFNIAQRSTAKLDGTAKSGQITIDGNGYFNSSNLVFDTLKIDASISSDAKVKVIDFIEIDASGNSEIYLFGNPKININSFFDSSKLQKKES